MTIQYNFFILVCLVVCCNGYGANDWSVEADQSVHSYNIQTHTYQRQEGQIPGLRVFFSKWHTYRDNSPWRLEYIFEKPLNLSKAKRFTCTFQTDAGHGYYSGRWYLVLIDINGKEASYLINKEAWKARKPVFVEQGIASGYPADFVSDAVSKIQIRGYVSVHKQNTFAEIRNLTFDDNAPHEAESRRVKRWRQLRDSMMPEYGLFIHPVRADVKLSRDDWDMDWNCTETATLKMNTALNGHDDAQVAVLAEGESKDTIEIIADDFVGPGNARISSDNLSMYELLWIPTVPKDRKDYLNGWYPDILKPIDSHTLPVDPRRISVVWLEMHTPESTVPGTYTGKIEFTRNSKKRTLTVNLTVHNFKMPRRPNFRTSFWLFPDRIAKSRGIKPENLQFKDIQPYIDIALAHRVTPVSANYPLYTLLPQDDGTYEVDLSKWEQYYEYVMKNGGNSVHIGDGHFFGRQIYHPKGGSFRGETLEHKKIHIENDVPPHRRAILQAYFEKVYAFLDSHDYADYAYLQTWDEATGYAMDTILPTVFSVIGEISPRTKILNTGILPPQRPELCTHIAIPVPTIPVVDNPNDGGRGYVNKIKSQGKHPWFYTCMSYGITIPEVGIRDRLLPLYGFNSGAEGYLYWALNWRDDRWEGFPESPLDIYRSNNGVWSTMGDGQLLYPTAAGQVLPSTRLKMFRAGMEDYEFLRYLADVYENSKDILSPDQCTQIEGLLSLDTLLFYGAWVRPDLVEARRNMVGRWIDVLLKTRHNEKSRNAH